MVIYAIPWMPKFQQTNHGKNVEGNTESYIKNKKQITTLLNKDSACKITFPLCCMLNKIKNNDYV